MKKDSKELKEAKEFAIVAIKMIRLSAGKERGFNEARRLFAVVFGHNKSFNQRSIRSMRESDTGNLNDFANRVIGRRRQLTVLNEK